MNYNYGKILADKFNGGSSNTGLPSWAKGLIAVTVVGAGVFIGYKVYKAIQGTDRTQKKEADDVVKEQEKEIKDLIKKGDTPSKPLSTYKSSANTIFELLDGYDSLDSQIKVVQEVVKQVKKPLDWKILSREFGKREVDNAGPFTGSTWYELSTLLKEQLETKVPTMKTIMADGFAYSPLKSGIKTTYEILNIYLKTIGVVI